MKKNYYNADGGHTLGGGLGATSPTAGSGGSLPSSGSSAPRTSNPNTGALYMAVAQIASTVIEGFFAQGDQKRANELQVKLKALDNQLEVLSADAQLALLNRAYVAQNENEKLALLNEVFAMVAMAQLRSTAYNPNESYVAALTQPDITQQVQEDKKQHDITIAVFLLVGGAILLAAFIEYKKINH